MLKGERDGKYIITVCADGFVSIMERGSKGQRRNGSALPAFAVDDITDAMLLIQRLCVLGRCSHGRKTGTLIEPRMIGWPEDADLRDLDAVADKFEEAYAELSRRRTQRRPAERVL